MLISVCFYSVPSPVYPAGTQVLQLELAEIIRHAPLAGLPGRKQSLWPKAVSGYKLSFRLDKPTGEGTTCCPLANFKTSAHARQAGRGHKRGTKPAQSWFARNSEFLTAQASAQTANYAQLFMRECVLHWMEWHPLDCSSAQVGLGAEVRT